MNYLHFLSFIIFVFSVLFSGMSIYQFLDKENKYFLNRTLYLGEILLLGGIFVVGEMLVLS